MSVFYFSLLERRLHRVETFAYSIDFWASRMCSNVLNGFTLHNVLIII
jgi:hypothetical protein